MSGSIRLRIGDCGSNSLSPEPCALIPNSWAEGPMHRYGTRGRVDNRRLTANAAPTQTATMHALRQIGGR